MYHCILLIILLVALAVLLSFLKTLVYGKVVLLLHQAGLMNHDCPLGTCTLVYWRQTPERTGEHQQEVIFWDQIRNTCIWTKMCQTQRK